MPARKRASDADLPAVAGRRRRDRRHRASRRSRLTGALVALAVVILAVAAAAVVAAAVAPTVIATQCDLRTLRPISIGTNSFLTASDGSFLGTIPAKQNRQQLRLRRDVAVAA